jgi:DNA-binding MarR family transcriptional regulator
VKTAVDDVWDALVSLVMESRTDWRREACRVTGLPFNQIRALKRIGTGPLTLAALADSMTVDAPAATVAVNGLERAGLVARTPHPTNTRAKLVELTPDGRRMLDAAMAVADKPPQTLTALSAADLRTLARVVEQLREPTRSATHQAPLERKSKFDA